MQMTLSSRSALTFVAALLCTTAAGAQQAPVRATTASIVGGVSQWDLSGTGTSPFVGVRIDRELNGVFLGEAGVTAMRPAEQFGERVTCLFPEVQLQAQLPFRVVRPYLGVGGGYGIASSRGEHSTDGTVAGAGGVRILVPNSSTTLRAELRVRGVGTGFTGATAEWTLGVGHRF